MNESEPCSFIVDQGRYLPERRPCANWATTWLGDVPLCPSHLRKITRNLELAIHWGRPDRPDRSAMSEGSEHWHCVARNALVAVEEDRHRERLKKRKAERQHTTVVYFMERDGFVKIGYTANLAKRQRDIGKGSSLIEGMTVGPVRVLAIIPGDKRNEAALHAKFEGQRVGGEWFLLDDELWTFIISLKGFTGEPRTRQEKVGR